MGTSPPHSGLYNHTSSMDLALPYSQIYSQPSTSRLSGTNLDGSNKFYRHPRYRRTSSPDGITTSTIPSHASPDTKACPASPDSLEFGKSIPELDFTISESNPHNERILPLVDYSFREADLYYGRAQLDLQEPIPLASAPPAAPLIRSYATRLWRICMQTEPEVRGFQVARPRNAS